jgi:DNA-binding GntR family transcriptional regulator
MPAKRTTGRKRAEASGATRAADSLAGLVESSLRGRKSAAEHIADALRNAIQMGHLADGTELNQVALSAKFGVSRIPVREALCILEAEGWISSPANYRAFVRELSLDDVEQIFRVRTALELDLLETALERSDREHVRRLRAQCSTMENISGHAEWLAANRIFHRILLGASGAAMVIGLIEQLGSQVERYLRQHKGGLDRRATAHAEHRAIVKAVDQRDAGSARRLLRAHIEHTRAAVIRAIGELRAKRTNSSLQEDRHATPLSP